MFGEQGAGLILRTAVMTLATLKQRQGGCHLSGNIFKHIFLNENVAIVIKISLKFLPKGPNENNPVLVQVMAWCLCSAKPLSEPMIG